MIIGTGIDIVDSKRIQKLMYDHVERFAQKYFTDHENEQAQDRKKNNQHILFYAKRWAAKEALAKALGSGFQDGLSMKDMEISNDALGKPTIQCHGAAAEKLSLAVPENYTPSIHLSLSDEPPYAIASVIIEALAKA